MSGNSTSGHNNAQQPKDGETWILIIVNMVSTFERSLVPKKNIVNIDSSEFLEMW